MHECNICKSYARRTLAEIMRHIREVHPHFEGKVKCIVSNCPSTLSTYESLRHHMYKNHKEVLKDDCCYDDAVEMDNGTDVVAEPDLVSEGSSTANTGQPIGDDTCTSNYKAEAAKFILKTQEGKKLTQTVTEGIIRDTSMIIENTIQHLKEKVYAQLKDVVGIEAHLEDLEKIFKSPEICNPFQQLQTRYQQEKYFQEHFNYVVSSSRLSYHHMHMYLIN